MFRSLRLQLGAIVFGLVLLVAGSVAVTGLALQEHAGDTALINLAGRQRMLTQQMIWLVAARPDGSDLRAAVELFDQTLQALTDGGTTLDSAGFSVTLPPATEPGLRAQLDQTADTWVAFRAHLEVGDAAAAQAQSPILLAQLDSLVTAYEAQAQAKLARFQIVQFVFFAAAVALMLWGYVFTRRRFMRPLVALNGAAKRIAAGQLEQPVSVAGDDEFAHLARALDVMRAEIFEAQSVLESQVTRRTREITAAFELSQEIIAQLDLQHVLRSVTERARALTGADAASLCLLDQNRTALVLSASSGDGNMPQPLRQPIWLFPANRVAGEGETIVTETACTNCGFLRAHGAGHCIATPLRVGQYILGELCVVRDARGSFDPNETRALTLLANSAAIAITNARLIEAERQQAEQAAALSERERLAADLHDHLAQTLGFLNLETDRVKMSLSTGELAEAEAELERMKAATGTAYRQVRAALVGLRDPLSDTSDLTAKLEECLAEFRQASGLPADLIITDPSALQLSHVSQAQALLVVREALINVRRHAQARQAWVRIDRTNGHARFTIEDDGCGFSAAGVEGGNHLGLAIMRTRAERSGGSLQIESTTGQGTKVIVQFPIEAQPLADNGQAGSA